MPFDLKWPALSAVDNADGAPIEEPLPDDLGELAAQLTGDARHLAERYPAVGRPLVNASRPNWRRYAAAAAILVAVSSGLTILAMRLWSTSELPKAIGNDVIATAPNSESSKKFTGESHNSSGVAEVNFDPTTSTAHNLSEVQMLRIQVGAFEQVIHRLQHELDLRRQSETDTQKQIEVLKQELSGLRQQRDERDGQKAAQ